MITYDPDEMYLPGDDVKVVKYTTPNGFKITQIDNFFKHPEFMRDMALNNYAPVMWKNDPSNLKDYQDCRQEVYHKIPLPITDMINYLVSDYDIAVNPVTNYSTNLFRTNEGFEPKEGFVPAPHIDPFYTLIIYLNKDDECKGGTSFYRDKTINREYYKTLDSTPESIRYFDTISKEKNLSLIETIDLVEQNQTNEGWEGDDYNYFVDGDVWEEYFVGEMKFNRAILYPGLLFHGAKHQKGWYDDDWRVNMVFFLTPSNNRGTF